MKDEAEQVEFRDVTLTILAGGAGSRMGGPKGSLVIHGKPILEFLLDRFAWQGPTMLVLAPGIEKPSGWERFSYIASDPVSGQGPLRGILTALEKAQTPIVVVATVDMPGVQHEQLKWIVRQLDARVDLVGVMNRRANGDIEPFPSAYQASARESVQQQLGQRRRSVHGLLKLDGFRAVTANWSHDVWRNVNTPADLEQFQRTTPP